MKDFNGLVGEESGEKEVIKYGLGIRKERAEKLIEFYKRKILIKTCGLSTKA